MADVLYQFHQIHNYPSRPLSGCSEHGPTRRTSFQLGESFLQSNKYSMSVEAVRDMKQSRFSTEVSWPVFSTRTRLMDINLQVSATVWRNIVGEIYLLTPMLYAHLKGCFKTTGERTTFTNTWAFPSCHCRRKDARNINIVAGVRLSLLDSPGAVKHQVPGAACSLRGVGLDGPRQLITEVTCAMMDLNLEMKDHWKSL